jgi:hypothetical protein
MRMKLQGPHVNVRSYGMDTVSVSGLTEVTTNEKFAWPMKVDYWNRES